MRLRNQARILEVDITSQIVGTDKQPGYLIANGWTCIRLNSGLFRTKDGRKIRIGKKGMPDWIAAKGLRYFFLELKRPDGDRSDEQIEWHAMALRKGLPVITADGLSSFLAAFGVLFAEGAAA